MALTMRQKSLAARRWNLGTQTLAQVAAYIEVEVSEVEAYLSARKGYPGRLEPRRPDLKMPAGTPRNFSGRRRTTAPGEGADDDGPKVQVQSRKPVTLVAMPWD